MCTVDFKGRVKYTIDKNQKKPGSDQDKDLILDENHTYVFI